jgi:leucyl-tRNA synthetase
VMRDLGLTQIDEPFTKLLCQGMVLNEGFSRTGEKSGKRYYWERELDIVRDDHRKVLSAISKDDGQPVMYEGWTTMSKSKNNGVDPQDLIERYGADTSRLYMMFTAPPEATLEWNDAAVEGSYRFLRRVYNFGVKLSAIENIAITPIFKNGDTSVSKQAKALRLDVHTLLKQIDYDYQRMQYNTVVSGAMKLLNALEDFKNDGSAVDNAAAVEGFGILLRVLYPATPHISHTLWRDMGYAAVQGDLLDAPWPAVDEAALKQDEIELMLQVNGKLRGAITVPAGAAKEAIEKIALSSEAFVKFADGAAPKKVIVVPGRLVNIVV